MIERWLFPLLEPFRRIKGKWMGVKGVKHGIQGDIKRAKAWGAGAKDQFSNAAGKAKGAAGKAQGAAAGAQGMGAKAQGAAAGAAGGAAAQAQSGMGQVKAPRAKKMGLFGKKQVCPQCGQPQDKTWDQCPFCVQAAAAATAAAPPPAAQKTMFMAGAASGPATQLLGWLVPVKGLQKGELFTLKSQSVVGTDPATCDIVLVDTYMSSRHATIKAAAGVFILEDMGSTNGTFVNDKRVQTQELVDNDFVKFGQTLVKFKSL